MKSRCILLGLVLLASMVLAACGNSDAPTPDAMKSNATGMPDTMMPLETAAPGASGSSAQMADWLGTSLVDARTGQGFKLSDFARKVILVETMAVWCTNCYAQQQQIQNLQGLMGNNADLVSVSLDIDPNETPDILTKYVNTNSGFNWKYAIAPAALAREFGQVYGDQFLNPPSTPILIIDRHGIAHTLPFGIKTAQDLMQTIQPYLDAHL